LGDISTEAGRAAGPRPRARVLVVEDDAAMRDLLREALDEDGYQVEVAAGGRSGVDRVRQGGIDLVVSDVKMPDLDGLDMLREIKAFTPSPHVITITAFGSIDTAIRAVKLGAFDYITKPFDLARVVLAVERALRYGQAIEEKHRYEQVLEERVRIRTDELRATNEDLNFMLDTLYRNYRATLRGLAGRPRDTTPSERTIATAFPCRRRE
jgi:DNA-binding NtrC family response regulator